MSMTETIKLYDRDAYAIEFEADIISCEPNKADDKQFDIILNQTLFFPVFASPANKLIVSPPSQRLPPGRRFFI